MRRVAGRLPTLRAWDKQAVAAVVDELFISQRQLAAAILRGADGAKVAELVDGWVEQHRPLVLRAQQLISELKSAPSPDFAMLAVANRQLKAMLSGSNVS